MATDRPWNWCSSCGDVIACPHHPNETIVRVLEQENGVSAVFGPLYLVKNDDP